MILFRNIAWWAACLGAIAFATGCVSYPSQFLLESVVAPQASPSQPQSYFLRCHDAHIDQTSLRYQEAVEHIRRALAARGLYPAPNEETAEINIDISYGLGPPVTKRVYHDSLRSSVPRARHDVGVGLDFPMTSPSTEVYETVYLKCLEIHAAENPRRTGSNRKLWILFMAIENPDPDLRSHLPVLAEKAIDYIGTDSKGPQLLRIEKDGTVRELRAADKL